MGLIAFTDVRFDPVDAPARAMASTAPTMLAMGTTTAASTRTVIQALQDRIPRLERYP